MTTAIIDGTIEEALAGRRRAGLTVFKSIRFRLDDGSSREVTKAVVNNDVADALQPGTSGRFYHFSAFDMRGIHGVRTPDGQAVYAFPSNNQRIFMVIAILNLLFIAFRIAVDGQIPLLGVALLILGLAGWYFMGKGRSEAKRQFEADAGYSGSSAPTRPASALTQPLP